MRCIVAIDGAVVNAGEIEFTPVRTTAVAAGAVQMSQAFEVSLDGRLLRGAPGHPSGCAWYRRRRGR